MRKLSSKISSVLQKIGGNINVFGSNHHYGSKEDFKIKDDPEELKSIWEDVGNTLNETMKGEEKESTMKNKGMGKWKK